MIRVWLKHVRDLRLEHSVYDLGGLGYGFPHVVSDDSFHRRGFYRTSDAGWPAKALHKPDIASDHLERFGSGCYLDADAIPVRPLDIVPGDWDLAVTVRRPSERRTEGTRHQEFMGEINAGVIFFSDTAATRAFLPIWKAQTLALGSDQRALNALVGEGLPRNGSTTERAGLRVLCLPTDTYNFYYFPKPPPVDARILHLKGRRWRIALGSAITKDEFDLKKLLPPSEGNGSSSSSRETTRRRVWSVSSVPASRRRSRP